MDPRGPVPAIRGDVLHGDRGNKQLLFTLTWRGGTLLSFPPVVEPGAGHLKQLTRQRDREPPQLLAGHLIDPGVLHSWSRLTRSNSARSSEVNPPSLRRPSSRSACRHQFRIVSPEIPPRSRPTCA